MLQDKVLRFINSGKYYLFIFLILSFLFLSFYPTIYELSQANNLYDRNREFILEHNYYWPDFNLYLSKVREGYLGRWTAVERYTNEPHKGSLIQEFYVLLGEIGRVIHLTPNYSYQLGRIILAPLLLVLIMSLVLFYFKGAVWQILSFLVVISSGTFPRLYIEKGSLHVGRFMEWWTNIDSLQRITFIPHILFGQVVSFFLLYKLVLRKENKSLFLYIILGNFTGLVFPPSLITLDSVLVLMLILKKTSKVFRDKKFNLDSFDIYLLLFVILSSPALFYIYILTQQIPWSALVDFHRTHPMMIPFWEYILATGPIFFLGFLGAVVSVVSRDKKLQPLVYWVILTLLYAILFTYMQEQSPLRFTQTGLFIPLGVLGAYFIQKLWKHLNNINNLFIRQNLKAIFGLVIFFYLAGNLFMMNISLTAQTSFISQRVGADVPLVPYPPQTMYPLKDWMDGIRWLHNKTSADDVVLAEITAGNHIPAYGGNTVYFGQENTVNYEKKQLLADKFFGGQMSEYEARSFLTYGKISYVFFSVQEKEKAAGKNLENYYPFLKPVFKNNIVTIYH